MKITLSAKASTLCVLLSVFWAGEAQAARGSFEQRLSIDEPFVLDVSTGSGSIQIRTGSADHVEVKGHITVHRNIFTVFSRRSAADAEEMISQFESDPPVRITDGRLLVGHIKDRAFNRNVTIDYEIVVPVDTDVKSHTGSGSQTITGVAGPVEAETGSGKITLTDIGGAVAANSGSGAIRADGIAGAFEAHTGSGSVRLSQAAPGDVVVTTGSGSSELYGVVGALNVRAGSGRIVVDGRQEGIWKLDTGSGSVRIKLPQDAAFELDAQTGSGDIVIDHPLTVQGNISRKHLRGEVRGGGALLRIETGSGRIWVE